MTYIAIRRDAAEEFVAERVLQSTDYPEGRTLAQSLRKNTIELSFNKLSSNKSKNGIIVYGRDLKQSQFIVIDLEQSHLFSEINDEKAILYFQRTLRFAVKFWASGVLTPAEKVLNSKTAAIFPHPLSQKNGVRIAFDLNPDVDRLSKRNRSGRYLLVYKISTDQGDGPQETASLNIFRKFLDDLDALGSQLSVASAEFTPVWENSLSTTSLKPLGNKVDIHQDYDKWQRLLTEDQKKFIFTKLDHPVRIDGPAGTGKTACLSLAAIHSMISARDSEKDFRAIFITHSAASKRNIMTVLDAMGGAEFMIDQTQQRHLRVETLQSFCSGLLRQEISESEFVDTDAYDAKQLQLMYVDEALIRAKKEFVAYSRFMSDEFRSYMDGELNDYILPLIQHEISVVIKGRAKENLEIYKGIPPIPAALPIRVEGDKAFLWRIYELYREQLVIGGQFDTDDVVLSALSQLTTPIWRRRRLRDGFDAIFVDETHLFNMNELSIFHNLTRSEKVFPIAFAVDRSQAIGDRGWSDDIEVASLMQSEDLLSSSTTINVKGIFRCSPDIVSLAFSITSSGASLFTNFQDPMLLAHSNMTFDEERKARKPYFLDFATDDEMISEAFRIAEEMRQSMNSTKGDIAIVVFDDFLFSKTVREFAGQNRPIEVVKNRGDSDVVNRARLSGRFVLSLPDYIGGLEFDGVVLVGVDDGRVPPSANSVHSQSRAYLSFASHNKLYVAVTRARYQIAVLGLKSSGPSTILKSAIESGVIDVL